MTGLLVSVRSAAESMVALRAGVDLLDVKEPARGSLGRADCRVMAEVLECAGGRVPVSVALGELRDESDWGELPAGIAYAKLGLAGCAARSDWPQRWRCAVSELPEGAVPVAVAYADWKTSATPAPHHVLTEGMRAGCGAALLDTYDKRAGGLFDHCHETDVAEWIAQARQLGMRPVIAGSLTLETAAQAAALQPDYIAVRGAACRGGRLGKLDAERIVALRGQLAHVAASLRDAGASLGETRPRELVAGTLRVP